MLQNRQTRSGFFFNVILVIGGAVFALLIAWLAGYLQVPPTPPEAVGVNTENHEYYSTPAGTFRHVGPQWVTNDQDDCKGHDKEVLDGDPDYYPEACKLKANDATEADEWWKKSHPKWSAKAAYAKQDRAQARWREKHQPTQAQTPTNSFSQSGRDDSNSAEVSATTSTKASAEADETLRCLNAFLSNDPAKGQYMVRYRFSDPTCKDTTRGRFAVGYGNDPSDAAINYVMRRNNPF